jgi:hypothetical protein
MRKGERGMGLFSQKRRKHKKERGRRKNSQPGAGDYKVTRWNKRRKKYQAQKNPRRCQPGYGP